MAIIPLPSNSDALHFAETLSASLGSRETLGSTDLPRNYETVQSYEECRKICIGNICNAMQLQFVVFSLSFAQVRAFVDSCGLVLQAMTLLVRCQFHRDVYRHSTAEGASASLKRAQ